METKIERVTNTTLTGKGKGRGGIIKLKYASVLGHSDGRVSLHFFSKRPCRDGAAFVNLNENEALSLVRAILYASGIPNSLMLSRRVNKNGNIVVECYSTDGVVKKEPESEKT